MLVLDTTILSAVMGSRPEDALFTTSVCQAEILAGIAVMPDGRRRLALEAAALAMFRDDFAGRVLPFDTAAARLMPTSSRPAGWPATRSHCSAS